MPDNAFSAVAPLSAACALTVTVPARDEERFIAGCLLALARQRPPAGAAASERMEVIVYANNCRDATAAAAQAFATSHTGVTVHVIAARLARERAHVGSARKAVMDFAAKRFAVAGKPRGVVASVDADTLVDVDWFANVLFESRRADAVAGFVYVDPAELAKLPTRVRRLYALESAFRQLWAELEAAIDPLPEDPAPRHATLVGANFAVAAETYLAAGGISAVPVLEDRAFQLALRRIDARVRYALGVRAATSARSSSQVEGGFGSMRAELHRRGMRGQTFYVEHPAQILSEIRGRAVLRRLWSGTGTRHDLRLACTLFAVEEPALFRLLDRSLSFGTVHERISAHGVGRPSYEPVPVEFAVTALRAAASREKTEDPTRTSAASGAG